MEIPMMIHPLRQMIIRKNPLRGFENQTCLDVLDKELQFKKTKYAEDDIDFQSFLEKVKPMHGVPTKGWVKVKHPHDKPLVETWKQVMQQPI